MVSISNVYGQKRRGRIEVIASILDIAREGASKTRLVYKANLNFNVLNKYLNFLLKNGLITKIDVNTHQVYKTTEKGREFLIRYKQLSEILEGPLR